MNLDNQVSNDILFDFSIRSLGEVKSDEQGNDDFTDFPEPEFDSIE